MKKPFYAYFISVFVLSIINGGLLNISPAAAAQDVVKIGLSAPLTGDWAEYGNDFKRSVTMVIDRINRMGGIHGKKVLLEIADSRKVISPIIKTNGRFYECKIVYKSAMDPGYLDGEMDKSIYPQKDYHTLYFGEILACYESD